MRCPPAGAGVIKPHIDGWKFYGITHRNHVYCSPLSAEKFTELVALLDLPAGARALDIACGKAELLCQICEQYPGATGAGVDTSPYEAQAAREKVAARGRTSGLRSSSRAEQTTPWSRGRSTWPCASARLWVWGGYTGAIEALKTRIKPGGPIAVGEPFMLKEPDREYLDAGEGQWLANLVPHHENVSLGEATGLTFPVLGGKLAGRLRPP